MKKVALLVLIILFAIILNVRAEDDPILFDVTTEAYELLQNPISINEGEIWGPETIYELELDFEFEINGQFFNQILVGAGKGLTFPGYDNPKLWIWVSEWGGWPFLLDRGTDVSVSPIDYEVTGNDGERILKIQWQNAGIRDNEGDDPDDFVDFQIWICEGTNRTEIHYGPSQTSNLSFGYNDGPGFRFWNLEDDWGYCLGGYENLPSASWMEFIGPIGGCLLDGVPDEGKVFNFFPNPTVTVKEQKEFKRLDFLVFNNVSQNEILIKLIEFDPHKTYTLYVYNILGVRIMNLSLTNQNTTIKQLDRKTSVFIFVLNDDKNSVAQKILLN